MSFALPWWLLGWVPVAAAAVWTLLRPARQQAHVGSLALWQEAVASLDRSARRRSRRVTAAWLCLLAGAALAVGALGRPQWHTDVPRRTIGLVVVPTVELGTDWVDRPDASGASLADLLQRLSAADRMTCVLPPAWPAMAAPASATEVLAHLRNLPALPISAADVRLPAPPADVQHVVYASLGSVRVAAGPETSVVALADELPAVTLDALAAESLSGGRMQVFAAIRHHTENPPVIRVRLRVLSRDVSFVAGSAKEVTLVPSASRRPTAVWEGPAAAAIEAVLVDAKGSELSGPGTSACLVRRDARQMTVALVGADEPMVRKYLAADGLTTLVADAASADVVVASRLDPPPDKPALVLAPPAPPPAWRPGPTVASADLTKADLDASHAILRGVDLAGVAVRRLPTWEASDLAGGAVGSLAGRAFLLAPAPGAGEPRRVYLSFSLAPENTNLMVRPDGVVLLANVLRYLAGPSKAARAIFVSQTPLAFGPVPAEGFRPLPGAARRPAGRGRTGLLAPGLYADADGTPYAVSLTGLRGGERKGERDGGKRSMADAIDRVLAVGPQTKGMSVALWPWAAALAGVCWLAGWCLRLR